MRAAETAARLVIDLQATGAVSRRGPRVIGGHLALGVVHHARGAIDAAVDEYHPEMGLRSSIDRAQATRLLLEVDQRLALAHARAGRLADAERHLLLAAAWASAFTSWLVAHDPDLTGLG